MPYKDKTKQRAFQRESNEKRRLAWLSANGPCKRCGSTKDLEIDHKDPKAKVSHRIWSWSKARREAELAKCQALCGECHKKKTSIDRKRPVPHGTDAAYTRHACRCDDCRAAHRAKRRDDKRLYGC